MITDLSYECNEVCFCCWKHPLSMYIEHAGVYTLLYRQVWG